MLAVRRRSVASIFPGGGVLARRSWTPLAAALLFTAIAAIIGRDVLAQLGTGVANDAGDPLLTAAILKWNATHVPLTDAWWQFPSFYPTRDVSPSRSTCSA
jgi:hypothetical protein